MAEPVWQPSVAVDCPMRPQRSDGQRFALPRSVLAERDSRELERRMANPGERTMNDPFDRNRLSVFGLLLAIGLIAGGWALGMEIKATRLGDRYVTVKGLAERRVKSDLAVWQIDYQETGDDLADVFGKTEANKQTIVDFLKQQEIQSPEIALNVPRVVDTQANQYGERNRAPHRFIVDQTIVVRTSRVDQVAAAAQKTITLLQKGIVLNGNRSQNVAYKFNGLNSIKPDMISEATRNARAAADRFALDSGSRVGVIRQANQGFFSISAADEGSDTNDDGGFDYNADRSLMKTVRVVTTIEYYVEK